MVVQFFSQLAYHVLKVEHLGAEVALAGLLALVRHKGRTLGHLVLTIAELRHFVFC